MAAAKAAASLKSDISMEAGMLRALHGATPTEKEERALHWTVATQEMAAAADLSELSQLYSSAGKGFDGVLGGPPPRVAAPGWASRHLGRLADRASVGTQRAGGRRRVPRTPHVPVA